jgi:hypothetical protein
MSDQRAPKGYVSLGIPSGAPFAHFARTLFELAMYDQCHGGKHLHPNVPSSWIIGSSSIPTARNRIVDKFLEQTPDGQSDWLLFFDDDQLFEPHTLDLLMASADPVERPIVGLPVWRFLEDGDGGGVSVTHNVMDLDDETHQFRPRTDPLPEDTLLQVPGFGTGCMLIHRSVFHRTRDALLRADMPPLWFREVVHPNGYRESEDLWFCRVAGNAEIPLFINTTMTIRHVKPIVLDRAMGVGMVTI